MTATLEQANAEIRSAVEARLGATPVDDPKMRGYVSPLAGCQPAMECATRVLSETYAEWRPAFQAQTTAERTLHQALEAVRDRHGKYGPPTEHFARTAAMVNAAFGTTFTSADWALIMVLDKVARQLGTEATADAAVDIAGYAACHQECRRA
ncbi:MAG: hypothetical protein EBQ89_07140 [Alphaproteobacteria bacterium]|nr:hypothetical protein [Alphaproteobacteria bacterium]